MGTDLELDSLGREKPKDIGCVPLEMGIHEWSEWLRLAQMHEVTERDTSWFEADMSPIKIRVCKRCKKLEGDLV